MNVEIARTLKAKRFCYWTYKFYAHNILYFIINYFY